MFKYAPCPYSIVNLMARRCPSCGKLEENQVFIKNFCKECFSSHFQLAKLPTSIEVTRCTVCGRVRIGNNWMEKNKRTLGEVLKSNFKSQYKNTLKDFELKGGRRNMFDVHFEVEFNIEGSNFVLPFTTIIKFMQTQCVDCSRESGGYYDTIVQLRSKTDAEYPVDQMEAKIKRLDKLIAERGGYIRKTEKTETGFDVFVAGITPAMQASHQLSDKVKHTKKLIGRKNGKDLYRHTFCVRL